MDHSLAFSPTSIIILVENLAHQEFQVSSFILSYMHAPEMKFELRPSIQYNKSIINEISYSKSIRYSKKKA